jgi:hypothetical protein
MEPVPIKQPKGRPSAAQMDEKVTMHGADPQAVIEALLQVQVPEEKPEHPKRKRQTPSRLSES